MSDISGISDLSFDDSINDPDYGNPNSPIEVSDFENISEYETLCSIVVAYKIPKSRIIRLLMWNMMTKFV